MKLHQFSKQKSCYYCGAPPPSKAEHVPPQMMFNGFECDSIKVPSCENHNIKKCKSDNAIVNAIAMGADQVWKQIPSNPSLTSNVVNSIQTLKPNFDQTKKQVSLNDLIVDPPANLDYRLPYIQSEVNFEKWIRQLKAALVWSVVGKYDPLINWDEIFAWSPLFIDTRQQPMKRENIGSIIRQNMDIVAKLYDFILNNCIWRDGWSSYPRRYPADIYSFEIAYDKNPDDMWILFTHRFYNNTSIWYALFTSSPETKDCIVKAVK